MCTCIRNLNKKRNGLRPAHGLQSGTALKTIQTQLTVKQLQNIDMSNEMTPAQSEAHKLFLRFKELHENSEEQFDPTLENMKRWVYHIQHAESMPKGTNVDFSPSESDEALIASRVVNDWSEFDDRTKRQYDYLQSFLAPTQLWATGSRVDGTYIDGDSHPNIAEMRKRIGKQNKMISDYDFTVNTEGGELEPNILRPRRDICDYILWHNDDKIQPKIKIPMWDFSRLPKEEHKNVLQLFAANEWAALVDIHDKYQLSANTYCCDMGPVKQGYKYAIDKGLIEQ